MKKLSIIVSILIVFALFFSLGKRNNAYAQNASLYFSPSTYTTGLNQTFSIAIIVDTNGLEVSGVTADFTYPSDILQVVSIDSTNSEFGIEAEQDYDSTNVYLSRATSGGTSFSGIGEVAVVNFQAISSETATLTFTDDALVTSSGENPQDVLGTTGQATITAGNLPNTGLLDRSVTMLFYFLATALICIGSLGVLQYIKEREQK